MMVEAKQHHNGNECWWRVMLCPQRLRFQCHDTKKLGFVDSSEGIGRKGRMSSTTDRYRATILDGHRDRQIRRLRLSRHRYSGWWILPKRGETGSRVCEPAVTKEKAAEESGTRRGRIQLEPSGTSGLYHGITRHPCGNAHALYVRQPSAAESCKR